MIGRFVDRNWPIAVGVLVWTLVAVQAHAHDIPARVPQEARDRTDRKSVV